MKNEKAIVYLGNSGFPYGLAEVQKMILISKSLIAAGNTVTVICKTGIHDKKNHPDLQAEGSFEDIKFVYTTGTPFRNDSFIKRNLLKIKGVANEILLLGKKKKMGELDVAILSTNRFSYVVLYWILSKVYGFKTVLNYAEYYPGIKREPSEWKRRRIDLLYDKYAPGMVSAVFPISEFLITHLKKTYPAKKYFKIPVLTDVERYHGIERVAGEEYFLFCGHAGYKEIIKFIIDSYGLISNTSAFLYLVINGDAASMADIKEHISNNPKKDSIKIRSKLTEKELYTYYKNALALLIPLRDSLQDSARFPHKIGEYLASGNPVISTNYGEVKYYFKDKEDMLIADHYDINLFAEKMQFAIDHPALAREIGKKGKNIALNLFDYRMQAPTLDAFLEFDESRLTTPAAKNTDRISYKVYTPQVSEIGDLASKP